MDNANFGTANSRSDGFSLVGQLCCSLLFFNENEVKIPVSILLRVVFSWASKAYELDL